VRAIAFVSFLLLLAAADGSAETASGAGGRSAAAQSTALQIIEEQIRRSPPPLEPPGPDPVITGFSVVAAAASAGCAVWALYPASEEWEPDETPNEHLVEGMAWGGLQGLLANPYIAIGLSALLIKATDVRAEYGSLLDLTGAEREERAYLILRKRAERARSRRLTMALLTVGSTILPAGVYYLGSLFVDRTPQEQDFGLGYVIGIALGSLPWVALKLGVPSADEATFAAFEARRSGGAP